MESVWDYPRPPRVEGSSRRIRVVFDGAVIADTRRALRVLETSHPPTWYIPKEDLRPDVLDRHDRVSFCEFKGKARYFTVRSGEKRAEAAAWEYPSPTEGYRELAGHVAFYAGAMDRCMVDEEVVDAQAGAFYGGWITSDITGPFKGGAGTAGW